MTAYITPRNYYAGRDKTLRLIVIHTMETPEQQGRARWCAQYFAGPGAPQASAHACIDDQEVVLCLPPSATAWAAPGANSDGYQVEHAGYASQGAAGWADAYSQRMLALSATHTAQIARAAGIPLRHLTDGELAAGQAGFVGHDQVSRVYKLSDHTDPGPAFPWTQYMNLVAGVNPAANSKGENTMLMIHQPKAGAGGQHLYAIMGPGFWLEFIGQAEANAFAKQIGAPSVAVTAAFWSHCKRAATTGTNR